MSYVLPVRVTISLQGKAYARVRPDWQDTRTYRPFQDATEGTKYVRDVGRVAPLDKLSEMLVKLRQATAPNGTPLFDVLLDDATRHAMTSRTAVQWLDIQAVRDRIERIDQEIHDYTLAKKRKEAIAEGASAEVLAKIKGDRLFGFQRTGSQWLSLQDAALLADDMGLGKTLQVIVALPAGAPTLVVCPKSTKGAWVSETKRWRPNIEVRALRGRASFEWPKASQMIIMNYDILPDIHDRERCDGFLPPGPCHGCKDRVVVQLTNVVKVRDAHEPTCNGFVKKRKPCPGCAPFLRDMAPGTVVVLDECHKCKNDRTARSLQAKAINRAVRTNDGRNWLLSGTPLENTPKELWNVLDMAGLAELTFDNYPTFCRLFDASKKTPFGGLTFGLPHEEVKDRMRRHSLRRVKSEVLKDLPTKMWRDVEVEIDRKAIQACEKFLDKHKGGLDRFIELLRSDKIPFEMVSAVREALATAKIPAMLEFVKDYEEDNEPVVVFSAYRRPIEALAKRKGWMVIMGGLNDKQRQDAIDKFQAGKLKGLGVTIGAGAEGITLTRANQVVFNDLGWKPTENAQAEDRLLRIGQKRGVVVTILHANHKLDRRVSEVLYAKSQMIAATVDASRVSGDRTEMDDELDAYKAKLDEEMTQGEAERTKPSTIEHNDLLLMLTRRRYDATHEGMALSLLEDADAIGLTPVQWALAAHVASKGREPETDPEPAPAPAPPPRSTPTPKDRSMRSSDRDRDRRAPKPQDAARPGPAPVRVPNGGRVQEERGGRRDPRAQERVASDRGRDSERGRSSREERRAEREFERSEEDMEGLSHDLEDMTDDILDLQPEHRVQVVQNALTMLDDLEDQFCFGCGEEPPHEKPEDCRFFDEGGDNEPSSSHPPRRGAATPRDRESGTNDGDEHDHDHGPASDPPEPGGSTPPASGDPR